MGAFGEAVVWCACGVTILGILVRPRGIAEWIWALGGAGAVVVLGAVAPRAALASVAEGRDVYAFLIGMMILAELARREGVFEWVAGLAANAAGGSSVRLLALVYGVGVVVTVVLSNDATTVVLTPAVAAAVRRAGADPLPHVFACAFVANAASFVLPISNPANLVIFGAALPTLGVWVRLFALPSLGAVLATYAALAWVTRARLRAPLRDGVDVAPLRAGGRIALGTVALAAVALGIASGFGAPLGAVTLACGLGGLLVVGARDRGAFAGVGREVSWSTIALVAALFVLAGAADAAGGLAVLRDGVGAIARIAPLSGALALGFAVALATNVTNNLPAALLAGHALGATHAPFARAATAIAIDLGPNLATSGSLATVLWLVALDREGIRVSRAAFFRAGIVVMPPALGAALVLAEFAR